MDPLRLARYLAGEASVAERAVVEAWAAANAENAAELARLGLAWRRAPVPSPEWDIDRAWQKVQHRLRNPVAVEAEVVPIRRRRIVWVVAAAAILLLGLGLGTWWTGRTVGSRVYATGIGEQRTITLPDQSQVWLAPASRLELRAPFGRGAREVQLEGHAWFSVRHQPDRPFRVMTGSTIIQDLGTEFQVETHGGEVQVAVISGSVSIRNTDQPAGGAVTLGARDLAVVPAHAPPSVTHEVAVDRMVGWRTGTLAFDGRAASEVLSELERWYPVNFTLSDSTMAGKHLFVTVPTADLAGAVETIAGALGAKASQVGREIILTRADQR
jgi:transmembrane sensor